MSPDEQERFVRSYLGALETGELVGREEHWYTEDAVQIELPNRLNPHGARRGLAGIKAAARQGRDLVERQAFEIVSIFSGRDGVAVEAVFSATFKAAVLGMPPGVPLVCRFVMILVLRGGKIAQHRTYDCFDGALASDAQARSPDRREVGHVPP